MRYTYRRFSHIVTISVREYCTAHESHCQDMRFLKNTRSHIYAFHLNAMHGTRCVFASRNSEEVNAHYRPVNTKCSTVFCFKKL